MATLADFDTAFQAASELLHLSDEILTAAHHPEASGFPAADVPAFAGRCLWELSQSVQGHGDEIGAVKGALMRTTATADPRRLSVGIGTSMHHAAYKLAEEIVMHSDRELATRLFDDPSGPENISPHWDLIHEGLLAMPPIDREYALEAMCMERKLAVAALLVATPADPPSNLTPGETQNGIGHGNGQVEYPLDNGPDDLESIDSGPTRVAHQNRAFRLQ